MKLTQMIQAQESYTPPELEAKVEPSNITVNIQEEYPEAILMDQIPSGFRPYSEKSLYIRGMTYGELKTISRMPNDTNWGYTTRVLGTVCNGFPLNKLAPIDLKAILLTISAMTEESHHIKSHSTCPICQASNYSDVSLDDIEFQELLETHLKLETKKGTLVFRYLTVEDMLYLENLVDHPLEDILNLAMMLTKAPPSEAESLDAFAQELKDALDTIFNLNLVYRKRLDEIEERLLPDIQSIEQTCMSCKSPFRTFLYVDPDLLCM